MSPLLPNKATPCCDRSHNMLLITCPGHPCFLLRLEYTVLLNKIVLQSTDYFTIGSLQNVEHASFRLQVLHLLTKLGFVG